MPATLLGAVASSRRCEILRLLWRDDLTVGAIHEQMSDVTIGAVSLQLKVLLDAGLVERRADGVRRVYHARRDTLAPVARLLEGMWNDALWQLKLQAELEETRRGPQPARRARRARMKRRKR